MLQTLQALVVPLVLMTMASVTTGCGGSSESQSLTRAELIAKADTICKNLHAKIHANGSSTSQEIIRKVPQNASYEQTALSELRKLQPPTSIANDWKQILNGNQVLADDTVKLGRTAAEGHIQLAKPLISAAQRVQQQVLLTAKHDGFDDCAKAS